MTVYSLAHLIWSKNVIECFEVLTWVFPQLLEFSRTRVCAFFLGLQLRKNKSVFFRTFFDEGIASFPISIRKAAEKFQGDQDILIDCDRMRFIFRHSYLVDQHTSFIGVAILGSLLLKVINSRDNIIWNFQPKNFSVTYIYIYIYIYMR